MKKVLLLKIKQNKDDGGTGLGQVVPNNITVLICLKLQKELMLQEYV